MNLHRLKFNGFAGLAPMETNELKVVVGSPAPETTVTVVGRVSMESSPYLRWLLLQLIRRQKSAVIAVDIGGVTNLDTSGIATLLEVLPVAGQQLVKLRLVGVRGQPRMLVEMTNLAAVYLAAGSEVHFS